MCQRESPPVYKLPATKECLDCQKPVKPPYIRKQYGPKEVEETLSGACKKLQLVEKERYTMKLKAKIEACEKGTELPKLKHIEW